MSDLPDNREIRVHADTTALVVRAVGEPEPGRAPDLIEPIEGWRTFRVAVDALALHSPVKSTYWPPRAKLTAECKRGRFRPPHAAPAEWCKCGIYAAADLGHAWSYGRLPAVLARVKLAGKVIPGTLGWRASEAWISELTTQTLLPDDLLFELAEKYGVPVVDHGPRLYTPLEEVVQQFASVLAAALDAMTREMFAHGPRARGR